MCIKMFKKFICVLIVCLMSMDSFASVVSDNDGSSFITKAEFDSLKNNFQSRIDSYNQGLDDKIDRAIASYLSGVNIGTETIQNNLYKYIGKDIKFGNVPVASTNIKYQIFQAASLMAQADGYAISGVKIHVKYIYGSNNWIGGTSDSASTGTYNLFQDVNGYRCFYGKTVGEYCKSAYSFSGDVMTPKTDDVFTSTIPGGANTVGGAKQNGTDDLTRYGWNEATDLIEWYVYDPTTATWGNKMTYFSRIDSYVNGTLTSYNDLMASGAVIEDYYDMIDYDHREPCIENEAVVKNDNNWDATNIIMSQDLRIDKFNIQAPLKFYYPKLVKNVAFDSLNNLSIAQSLNIGMPLYGGVPLFKATDDGTVTFTLKMNTTNTGAATQAYFALVDGGIDGDRCFANADTFSIGGGDVKFDAWDVIGDVETKFATDAYYVCSYVDGRKLKVQFETKKDHTYVFKMKPSTLSSGGTNIYAYADNFSDIKIKKDNS